MERGIVTRASSFAVVAALAFGGGYVFGQSGNTQSVVSHFPIFGDGLSDTPDPNADLSSFWKAWNVLGADFVETHASSTIPDTKKKLYGAISGLASSYGDPYTVFFPPAESKQFQESIAGNFTGVGMEMDIKNGVLTVIAPLKGSPADLAGVKAGDAIIAINGKSTEGLPVDQAVTQIRGPKGTQVSLTLARDKKSFDIKITRDVIQVPESDDGLDAKTGVYHIALYEFTATSADLFNAAFKRFKESGSKYLVLDLRGNPGGYLEAAVEIASHFLPKGTVVVTEDHKGKAENEVHVSEGANDVPKGTKVVVLINQGSASASEILAGALQDNKVATLIGTRSFGKGSVQQLVDLDGGSLKVTVARWLTPSGRSISDGGLTPDIKSDLTQEDITAKNDVQMQRAVQFLTTGK